MTLDKIIRPKWQCFVREQGRTQEYILDQVSKKVYTPLNLQAQINPFKHGAEFTLYSDKIEDYKRIWAESDRIFTYDDKKRRMSYRDRISRGK